MGEASSTHLCAAAQYAALLRPTSCLTAIAPTQHGFCRVAPGRDRHCRAVVISATPGARLPSGSLFPGPPHVAPLMRATCCMRATARQATPCDHLGKDSRRADAVPAPTKILKTTPMQSSRGSLAWMLIFDTSG